MNWNLLTVTIFELKRYLYSSRIVLLLLVSTIPTLFYLQFAIKEATTISDVEGTELKHTLLGILVYFSHFIATLIGILVISDIVAGERSLDMLLTSPTSRVTILGGKTLAAFLIVSLSIFFCFLSSYAVFIAIADLPSIEWLGRAFVITIILVAFPLTISLLFSVIALLSRDLTPSSASYVPLFLFFIIPFIVWTSVILRYFQSEMTDYTYLGWVDRILGFEFQMNQTTREQYELALYLISSLTVICFLIAVLIFRRIEGFVS